MEEWRHEWNLLPTDCRQAQCLQITITCLQTAGSMPSKVFPTANYRTKADSHETVQSHIFSNISTTISWRVGELSWVQRGNQRAVHLLHTLSLPALAPAPASTLTTVGMEPALSWQNLQSYIRSDVGNPGTWWVVVWHVTLVTDDMTEGSYNFTRALNSTVCTVYRLPVSCYHPGDQ